MQTFAEVVAEHITPHSGRRITTELTISLALLAKKKVRQDRTEAKMEVAAMRGRKRRAVEPDGPDLPRKRTGPARDVHATDEEVVAEHITPLSEYWQFLEDRAEAKVEVAAIRGRLKQKLDAHRREQLKQELQTTAHTVAAFAEAAAEHNRNQPLRTTDGAQEDRESTEQDRALREP